MPLLYDRNTLPQAGLNLSPDIYVRLRIKGRDRDHSTLRHEFSDSDVLVGHIPKCFEPEIAVAGHDPEQRGHCASQLPGPRNETGMRVLIHSPVFKYVYFKRFSAHQAIRLGSGQGYGSNLGDAKRRFQLVRKYFDQLIIFSLHIAEAPKHHKLSTAAFILSIASTTTDRGHA